VLKRMILVLTLAMMLVGSALAVPALAQRGPGAPPNCDWDYARNFWREYGHPVVWGYVCEDERGDWSLAGLFVEEEGWVWWDPRWF
jgi:hypothetical protein